MALDTAALTDIRNYIKRRVHYAKYKVGSTYYTAPISDIEVLSGGIVRAQLSIVPGGTVTVTWVGLYNSAGELWAHQDVSIIISTGQTGILYWFDFTVKEGT